MHATVEADADGEGNGDAFIEGEDIPQADSMEEEDNAPNNDFCFTQEDFIQTKTEMNDATRHQGTYHDTWTKIKELEGTTVELSSGRGDITWKVVPSKSIEDDAFKERRQMEEYIEKKKLLPVKDPDNFSDDNNFSKMFWFLWPGHIKDDTEILNMCIDEDNKKRKERYQRPIRHVSENEFVIFHALIIASAKYQEQGEKLWACTEPKHLKKRRKSGLSKGVDFNDYMKLWRFKQIKHYLPFIFENLELKDKDDDWWRWKTAVEFLNLKRREYLLASHVVCFDECMSAFVPRFVSFCCCNDRS